MNKSIELFPHTEKLELGDHLPQVLDKNWTCIGFVLDKSGSMETMEVEARTGYNAFVDKQALGPDPAALTTILFNHELFVVDAFRDIRHARHLTSATYKPDGMTALLDAMGYTIDSIGGCLDQLPEAKKPNRVIIVTLTDGLENSSKQFATSARGRERIQEKVTHQREKYSWEFLFLGAGFDAVAAAQGYGIPATHAATMHSGGQGLNTGFISVNSVMASYRMSARGDQNYVQHLASNKSWGGHNLVSKPEDDEPGEI